MKLRTADLVIVFILVLSLKGIIMNQLTLNIDVPSGIYNVKTKRTHSFRKLRGVMSSDKPYKEMLEDALKEKYSI